MGGERSEVHDGTTRVLMEVATWNGPGINYASWKLGLRSEASARFEKGLPPEGCLEAQAVATALMLELTGARLVPGTLDVGSPGEPEPIIPLRDARVAGLLGAEVPRERSAEILGALGFSVTAADDGLRVGVPHWRRARRDPRGRPHRGGRADRRAGAAARRRSRRTGPGSPGGSATPSVCAAARRTRSSAAGCSRSSAGRSPTPGCRTGCWRPRATTCATSSSSTTRCPPSSPCCARR